MSVSMFLVVDCIRVQLSRTCTRDARSDPHSYVINDLFTYASTKIAHPAGSALLLPARARDMQIEMYLLAH